MQKFRCNPSKKNIQPGTQPMYISNILKTFSKFAWEHVANKLKSIFFSLSININKVRETWLVAKESTTWASRLLQNISPFLYVDQTPLNIIYWLKKLFLSAAANANKSPQPPPNNVIEIDSISKTPNIRSKHTLAHVWYLHHDELVDWLKYIFFQSHV